MRSLLLQKILIKKIILYRTNILFLLSGVFFSQNYVFIIFVGRVLVGVGVGGGVHGPVHIVSYGFIQIVSYIGL